MDASRIVTLFAAAALGVVGACGDDDASESAATAGPASDPAVATEPPAVTQSTADGRDTTTASTTVGDADPWIAYAYFPADEPEGVFLVHPDGSDDHEILTETPYPALSPDWSRDGTRLAVQIYSRESVYVADADGSEPEVVARCTAFCGAIGDPAWSPSGEQLLVTRLDDGPERGTTPPDQPTSATVELVDLRTGERRDVLQSAYPELLRNPRWSPDGSSYVVTVQRYDDDGEQTGSAIAVGGLDGSPLKLLTEFEEWAALADWHPQDDILVYNTDPPPGSADGASNLFTIRADGTDVQAVTTFEPGGTRVATPQWTPDGSRILFTAVDEPSESDQSAQSSSMASIEPDGTGLERTPLAGRNGYHYTLQPTPG